MNAIQRMEGESDDDFNARAASLQELGAETPETLGTSTSGAETIVLNVGTTQTPGTFAQIDYKPEEVKLPGSRDVTFTEYKELIAAGKIKPRGEGGPVTTIDGEILNVLK